MNWLLPKVPALYGQVRTVGEPPEEAVKSAHYQRANARRRRVSRAAYFREYYARNIEKRRAYIAAKKREYRARRNHG